MATVAAGLMPAAFSAEASGKKMRIAAQMFSLRDIVWMDEHGFLAMIGLMKKFGYDGVEFAGVKVDPKELKKYMDDIGIVCASAHEGLDNCLKDKIAETCEKNLSYGNRNLVMPWAPIPENCKDKVGWLKKLGADLSDGAAVAKRYGCHLAYHNHGHEFTEKIGGVSYWDIIMSDATSDLECSSTSGTSCGRGRIRRNGLRGIRRAFGRCMQRTSASPMRNCVPIMGRPGLTGLRFSILRNGTLRSGTSSRPSRILRIRRR